MKKVLLFMLAAVLVFSFTACTNTAEPAQSPEASPVAEATYTGTYTEPLKMGTNAAFPPYEYKEGEAFKGIDVEIATAIAEELGTTLEVVDMEFDAIITAVQQGEVNFGMAGMTVTDERKEQVDFTSSYATGVQVVIVSEDSAIATLDDLAGKKIGTQLGTTGDMYSKDDYGEENVTSYGKGADAVIALKGGDVDAVIIDNEPAKAFVAENEGLKILETEYAIEDYAIAVAKENTALLADINAALEKLTADGTIDAIVASYIKAE
ncbi:MAG: transporter substrate-binding domain-containing protein [Ruminococcaceae bacterium]|nr:transporter substrate-binding domain-containing protein [Oscillospiraceae bacterium]